MIIQISKLYNYEKANNTIYHFIGSGRIIVQ